MQVIRFVAILLTSLITFCSAKGVERIVGGFEVSIEQAPYQVALLYYGFLRCGGSIISRKFVLTAAHCVHYVPASYLSIRAGSAEHASGGTEHKVGRVDIHPKYDNSLLDYDAAILTLQQNIQFDTLKKPIRLPFLNQALPTGTYVTTSGWGLTGDGVLASSVLRMVELRVTDQVECYKIYQEDGGITTRMVCAGAISKDSCDGDSGGPLVDIRTKKLVGIVSFGLDRGKCAIDGVPGVYTRVASIRPWIRQIVRF
ncbi:trypsin-3-like [Chironomus tepperi]|uniref:trypsin-3-like n=1 Tax=Chironomus tepperi TaxID=113505 RepID=UPI00391EF4E2